MTRCATCGRENRGDARFCDSCGAQLAPSDGLRSERRRKPATLLFCDVTGSTALGERLDAEAVRELMFSFFDEMRAAIERHGGTVEKFVGDAVMAVFGVPEAHEDDPLRALRAAAEMRERLAPLNERLDRLYGLRLRFRIGVNSGEVVAGDASTRETFVSGDAVNVAARLEQAAAPGEIVLGETTYRLARHAIEAEPLPPVRAKGKDEPVGAYRLIAVSAADERRSSRTRLVGRATELASLERLFEQAAEERRFVLTTILGEPGVGKTRLATELIGRVRKRARVHVGRCLAYGEGAELVVVFAPNSERGWIEAVGAAMHAAPTPTAVSISWGAVEGRWTGQALATLDSLFHDAALLGITVCCSSGDHGSSGGSQDDAPAVAFPASSPHVLACGGTTLDLARRAERAWNDAHGASGGGYSAVFPRPSWQRGLPGSGGRAVPDVAANAVPGYSVVVDGTASGGGGTSAAAPLVAGLVLRIAERLGRIGYLTPLLYADKAVADAWRNVTEGDNGAFVPARVGTPSPAGAARAERRFSRRCKRQRRLNRSSTWFVRRSGRWALRPL